MARIRDQVLAFFLQLDFGDGGVLFPWHSSTEREVFVKNLSVITVKTYAIFCKNICRGRVRC